MYLYKSSQEAVARKEVAEIAMRLEKMEFIKVS